MIPFSRYPGSAPDIDGKKGTAQLKMKHFPCGDTADFLFMSAMEASLETFPMST